MSRSVHQDLQVHLDHPVLKDIRVNEDNQAQKVNEDQKALKVLKDHKDQLVFQVRLAHLALLENQAFPEKEETLALKEYLEKPDHKVLLVYQANLEDPAHRVNVGKKDLQEKEVLMDFLVYLALQVFQVRTAWMVSQENQEFLVNVEHPVNEEIQDFQEEWECQA